MRRDLQNCRLLITGASSGIGRCLAEQAVRAGAHVVLTACSGSGDRLPELIHELKGLPGEAVGIPADITQEADRRRLLQGVVEHLGGLDVLVNNAGVGNCASFAESNEDTLRQIMEVNFFAPAELIRLAIPILEQGRLPVIVNVADMCGRRGRPSWSEYSASKFALCGLTEALRGEMARFDIDVLLIILGETANGFGQHLLGPSHLLPSSAQGEGAGGLSAARVAASILGSLQRNRTETVVGRKARWLLLGQRFFPRLLERLIAR